jgi:hypothetical protein
MRPCEAAVLLRIVLPDFQFPSLGVQVFTRWVVLGCP